MNIFEHNFTAITGGLLPLRNFQGQPLLLVNIACRDTYTIQFRGLQTIWNDYKKSGLVIVGIPSWDFSEGEPMDDEALWEFMDTQYQVNFPVTSSQQLVGRGMHPLFLQMLNEYGNKAMPRWNFYKWLFSGDGQLQDYWPAAIDPADPTITHVIERNLHSWVF